MHRHPSIRAVGHRGPGGDASRHTRILALSELADKAGALALGSAAIGLPGLCLAADQSSLAGWLAAGIVAGCGLITLAAALDLSVSAPRRGANRPSVKGVGPTRFRGRRVRESRHGT